MHGGKLPVYFGDQIKDIGTTILERKKGLSIISKTELMIVLW